MTIDELCDLFGISRQTVWSYRGRGIIPPPSPPRGPAARYTNEHIEAIRAFNALKHNNVNPREVIAFCKEEGMTLPQYVAFREESIRAFGLGVA